jgi:hypothetical protein
LRPHGIDPFQVGAGLKVLAIAFQDNDAKQRLAAQFIHRREHALNEAGIIGVVDLRAVQRDRRNPSFVEVPQNWIGRHWRSLSLEIGDGRVAYAGNAGSTNGRELPA